MLVLLLLLLQEVVLVLVLMPNWGARIRDGDLVLACCRRVVHGHHALLVQRLRSQEVLCCSLECLDLMTLGVVERSLCLERILVELNVLRLPHLLVMVLLPSSDHHGNVVVASLNRLLPGLNSEGGIAIRDPGECVLGDLLAPVEDALELSPDQSVVRDVFVLKLLDMIEDLAHLRHVLSGDPQLLLRVA